MQLGMVGLGRMGMGMTKRLQQAGHDIKTYDPNVDSTAKTLGALAKQLDTPRHVWMMVPAGKITEDTFQKLLGVLEPGDTIIDGGNSNFRDSQLRYKEARKQKISFVDTPWVDRHIERLGGWRLAPRVLIDQLHALREPAPLVLVPRRQMRRLNAQLEFLGEAAEIVVHPDDAAAAGVSDDQRLIVRSEHGELTGVARVDASVRRGAVSVPHGHAGANVNLLTSKDDIDPVTGMTRYSGVPVSLHPA